jgi:hypothetical protein
VVFDPGGGNAGNQVKTITPQLRTHLAQPVTTLATCWLLERTDGTTYAFTSFDEDLVIGGVTYLSTAGFTRSAVQTGSTGEVDNLDVVGFFQDDAITERDLKNGLFDYASIHLFAVNWANLSQGICKLRRGWLGECTLTPAGIFKAELRGMTQALVQEFGADYMPICRADLGDSKCKVPIKPSAWSHNTPIAQGSFMQAATRPDDAMQVAIFEAQNSGTTGSTEPAWDPAIGATTTDHDISWVSKPYWRGIFSVASVINQREFVSSLSVPAAPSTTSNTGSVSFRLNVSANTTITVSDGVVSHGFTIPIDAKPEDVLEYFYPAMASYTDWSMAVTYSGATVYFTNTSGQPGSITKIGDTLRGIIIQDFQSAAFDGGTVTWIDGDNAGTSMEIKAYDTGSSTVVLWLRSKFPIAVGDRFFAYPGCDKRRDTCVNIFNNILNFRGEPDMPMMDKVLSYPDA